ncbi:MAG TPA: glycosyltransferase, partial [Allosphingosinicella sp.]|nr:glycosyltransferase [Allosphingosinicella sp.]
PEVFAEHLATVHVPRKFYSTMLPGIPTIRVFEALACGIPLVSAPWEDSEGLFRTGEDYLTAANGAEMTRQLRRLRDDPDLRASLAVSGLETIRARHTCAHRADELLAIVQRLKPLPFRGGVGVGEVEKNHRRQAIAEIPHPSIPSPEGEGRRYA